MNKDFLVIGSRPYNNLELNDIIDTFKKNIRLNMSLPNENNGTKIDEQFLNCHVYEYTIHNNKKNRDAYINILNKDCINKYDSFDKSKWTKIHCQNNSDIREINMFLKDNNLEQINEQVLRVGFNAIWMLMKRKNVKIFVHGFSLNGHVKKRFMNPKLPNCSSCHNIETEQRCLINLHKHHYLDATLCCLEDIKLPTFDCQYIKPKLPMLLLFLTKVGIIQLNHYKSDDICNDILIKLIFNSFHYCALYNNSKDNSFIIMNIPYSEYDKYKTNDDVLSLVNEKK